MKDNKGRGQFDKDQLRLWRNRFDTIQEQFEEAGDQLEAFKDDLEKVSFSWKTIQDSRANSEDESAPVLDKEGRD